MSKELLKDLIVGFLVLLTQLLLFRYLKIFGAESDIVLLYLVWIISTRERTSALVHAAVLGLCLDFFLDTWGLHIISKTLVVFILYNFIPRLTETRLSIWQIFILLLGVGFLHNLFFAGIAQFAQIFRVDSMFWIIWFGNTLFTAAVGSFIYMFKSG